MLPGNDVTLRCPHCSVAFESAYRLFHSGPQAVGAPPRACASCGKEFELFIAQRPLETIAAQPAINPGLPSSAPAPYMEPIVLTPQQPLPPIPEVPSGAAAQAPSNVPQAHPVVGPMPSAQQIASSPCANHPGNQSITACAHCHRCLCNLCAIPADTNQYCPQCFDGLRGAGGLSASQKTFDTPKFVFNLGLATLFLGLLSCCGFITGPLGIYLGFRGLEEIKQRPHLQGRQKIITGMILNAVGLLVMIAGIVALIAFGVLDELAK